MESGTFGKLPSRDCKRTEGGTFRCSSVAESDTFQFFCLSRGKAGIESGVSRQKEGKCCVYNSFSKNGDSDGNQKCPDFRTFWLEN